MFLGGAADGEYLATGGRAIVTVTERSHLIVSEEDDQRHHVYHRHDLEGGKRTRVVYAPSGWDLADVHEILVSGYRRPRS